MVGLFVLYGMFSMPPHTILQVIIAIVSLSFVADLLLEYINWRWQRKHQTIPDSVAAFYDRDKYARALAYHNDRTKFAFITSTFGFLMSLGMLLTGGFGWIDAWLRSYIGDGLPLALAFFAVIMVASDLVTLPFQWYSNFVIEARYGFNKMTIKTFLLDKVKGYLLSALIGGALLSLLIVLVRAIGPQFWWWFGLAAATFMLAANMFYTTLILPLFNKLTPLPGGSLKEAIEAFSQKVRFPLDNIYVMDGSRRSAKANAFFSGIGKKKKIVLFDTLLHNHGDDELVAVLAHEVGHFKKKHIVWTYILSLLQIFLTLFVLSLMILNENLSLALGGSQLAIHLNLVAFAILFSPISSITGWMMSIYRRKNEYEADAYARDTYNGHALSEALKRLSVDSLSPLYPHPLYVFFHYSHPPLLKRLEALVRHQ